MASVTPSTSGARLQEWSNLHSQLFWTYRGAVHPAGRDGQSNSRNLFAWLILRGACTSTCERGTTHAEAGEWLFPPFGPRAQKFTRGARIISVCFRAEWPGGHSLYDHGSGLTLRSADFPELEHAAIAQVEFVAAEFPSASNRLFLEISTLAQHWEIQLRFTAWLGAYCAALDRLGVAPARPFEADTRLARALQVIERHALNLPFREADVARAAGLSVPHLHRLFVRQVGKTPRERYEERREQAAVALVEQSSRPLKVISADLGFSSPSHFSRWFSRRLQSAPRHRRQQPVP